MKKLCIGMITWLVTQVAAAATVTYSSGPFNASYDIQYDLTGNFSSSNSAVVTGLQQFDASLGTLTGVTFDITAGQFEVDASLFGEPAINELFSGEFSGNIQGDLVYFNGSSSLVIEGIGDSLDLSCSGSGRDSCDDGFLNNFDYATDSFTVPRSLPEFNLVDIVGTGDVSNLSLSIAVFDASFVDSLGLNSLEVSGTANIINATVDVTYEYTAVPLPTAAWLFGSALISLTGLRKKARD